MLEEMAGLHAPCWEAADLAGLDWLNRNSVESDGFLAMLVSSLCRDSWSATATNWRPSTSRSASSSSITCPRTCRAGRDRARPATVTSGWTTSSSSPASAGPVVVDWQTWSWAAASYDVAYFIGGCLSAEDRRAHEDDLLAHYHDALRAGGVQDYSLDQLRRDTRRDAFGGILMAIVASMVVQRTDRGDLMFLTSTTRHAQHASTSRRTDAWRLPVTELLVLCTGNAARSVMAGFMLEYLKEHREDKEHGEGTTSNPGTGPAHRHGRHPHHRRPAHGHAHPDRSVDLARDGRRHVHRPPQPPGVRGRPEPGRSGGGDGGRPCALRAPDVSLGRVPARPPSAVCARTYAPAPPALGERVAALNLAEATLSDDDDVIDPAGRRCPGLRRLRGRALGAVPATRSRSCRARGRRRTSSSSSSPGTVTGADGTEPGLLEGPVGADVAHARAGHGAGAPRGSAPTTSSSACPMRRGPSPVPAAGRLAMKRSMPAASSTPTARWYVRVVGQAVDLHQPDRRSRPPRQMKTSVGSVPSTQGPYSCSTPARSRGGSPPGRHVGPGQPAHHQGEIGAGQRAQDQTGLRHGATVRSRRPGQSGWTDRRPAQARSAMRWANRCASSSTAASPGGRCAMKRRLAPSAMPTTA